MRFLWPLMAFAFILLTLSLATQVHAAVSAGSSGAPLFFDDFTATGFPSQWTAGSYYTQGNVTQSGSFANIVTPRTTFGAVNTMVANKTSPIVWSLTNNTLIYNAWRLQPMNVSIGGGAKGATQAQGRAAWTSFGLASPPTTTGNCVNCVLNSIVITVFYTDNATGDELVNGTVATGVQQVKYNFLHSSGVFLSIGLQGGAACYEGSLIKTIGGVGVTSEIPLGVTPFTPCNQTSILYNNPGVANLDPNALHTFVLEGRFFQGGTGAWIALQVDQNSWMNITNTACNGCLSIVKKMYPFINTAWSFWCNNPCNTTPSLPAYLAQSLGTFVDWVLVDDYIPTALPLNHILSSAVTPPTTGPVTSSTVSLASCVGVGAPMSLTSCLQFAASDIGTGNVYFGGFWLILIFFFMIAIPLGYLGVRSMWVYGLYGALLVVLGTWSGIIALWMTVLAFFLMLGGAVGMYRLHLNLFGRHANMDGDTE